MTNPEDDRRLAKRLRAICRSVGDQVRAGELTEARLAYALRGVVGVADTLDLRARHGEATPPAGTDEPADNPGNVVDLAERQKFSSFECLVEHLLKLGPLSRGASFFDHDCLESIEK